MEEMLKLFDLIKYGKVNEESRVIEVLFSSVFVKGLTVGSVEKSWTALLLRSYNRDQNWQILFCGFDLFCIDLGFYQSNLYILGGCR